EAGAGDADLLEGILRELLVLNLWLDAGQVRLGGASGVEAAEEVGAQQAAGGGHNDSGGGVAAQRRASRGVGRKESEQFCGHGVRDEQTEFACRFGRS